MTEMNKNTENKVIYWIGFVASLTAAPFVISTIILAPLYVLDQAFNGNDVRGLLSLMIGLCSIGAVFYFVIGTPVLIWHLSKNTASYGRIVALAVISVLALLPVGGIISLLSFDMAPLLIAALCTGFGLIGAPPLAATFTYFYKKCTDE